MEIKIPLTPQQAEICARLCAIAYRAGGTLNDLLVAAAAIHFQMATPEQQRFWERVKAVRWPEDFIQPSPMVEFQVSAETAALLAIARVKAQRVGATLDAFLIATLAVGDGSASEEQRALYEQAQSIKFP